MGKHSYLYVLFQQISVTNYRGLRQIMSIPTRRRIIGLNLSLTINRTTFPNRLLRVQITNTIRHGITSGARYVNRHNVPIYLTIRRPTHPIGGSPPQLLIRNITRYARQIKLNDVMVGRRIQPIRTSVVGLAILFRLDARFVQRVFRRVNTGTTIHVD